jgi:hypothetical protein
MKTALLFCSFFLPLAATAQKLVATAPPKTYVAGKEKIPLYRTAADTAGKPSGFNIQPLSEVMVVGQFSPHWAIVKHDGFLYLASSASLKDPSWAANAQNATRTEEYCMILATQKFLSNKVTIAIDFGQERRYFGDNRYKDQEGRVQTFNSVIDVLNYQNSQGWEFVNAYCITVGQQNVYHYVMKRRITS